LPQNSNYASFLIRFHWTHNGDKPTWVVSIQSTKTGEQRWFPNLEALIDYLQTEYGDEAAGTIVAFNPEALESPNVLVGREKKQSQSSK
jgi:hypothetical protein